MQTTSPTIPTITWYISETTCRVCNGKRAYYNYIIDQRVRCGACGGSGDWGTPYNHDYYSQRYPGVYTT
jgi:hypothetical protein